MQTQLPRHLLKRSRYASLYCARKNLQWNWIRRQCYSTSESSSTNDTTVASSSSNHDSFSQAAPGEESIFSSKESVWDHVFNDIKEMPPLIPSAARRSSPSAGGDPLRTGRPRRQTMTAREINAFDEMFNMIFNAVSEQRVKTGSDSVDLNGDFARPLSIGKGTTTGDVFGNLRRNSKKIRWTSETDELLDRKKEAINMCDTDQQLLEWATEEVFGESLQYEAAWKKHPELPMQPPTYPHLVALLMRTFRDKYRDPHLALSIFNYARNISIASYVFGCSTQAYNELIETRWVCFKDVKGVHDALEEMVVNGVEFDTRTRKLVDDLRREVAGKNLWLEENDFGTGEVWNMLAKIDKLVKAGVRDTGTPGKLKWDEWKSVADETTDDDWAFGSWGAQSSDKGRNDTVSKSR
ncbi:hypothetical protein HGRIS_002358 [Hohenbuehelia grisea]|uniref:Mtf2-like C-terminal domain-containing protein n=1 Tax=Hohenbuehelia grisea TaxID=104357 RepID=A0ABR3JMB5_9AGAR